MKEEIVKFLTLNHMTISFAESCTGGMLASTIIDVPGASLVIKESYVTYSNEAKIRILGVKPSTIDKYTVYSKEVANEMAEGLFKITGADVCVGVTGISGDANINDCPFDFAIYFKGIMHEFHAFVKASRADSRKLQTEIIMREISKILTNLK